MIYVQRTYGGDASLRVYVQLAEERDAGDGGDCGEEEHGRVACAAGDGAGGWAGNSQGQINERGVDSESRAAILRRDFADRFDSQRGEDQREAKAGDRGADLRGERRLAQPHDEQ